MVKKYFKDDNPIVLEYLELIIQEYDRDKFTLDWLCEETGLNKPSLKKWAESEGLTRRAPRWTKQADQYLENYYHKRNVDDIAEHLGHSKRGVEKRAQKLGINKKSEGYTLTSLAEALGQSNPIVLNWIRKGWLQAEKRQTNTLNDWWYITNEDIRVFFRKYPLELDLAKLAKVPGGNLWLIDVMLGDTHKIGLGY